MARFIRIIVALSFGVGATGCTAIQADDTTAAPLPPPPPVVERDEQAVMLPTDGLQRFVVTPASKPEPDGKDSGSYPGATGSDPGANGSDPGATGSDPGANGSDPGANWL